VSELSSEPGATSRAVPDLFAVDAIAEGTWRGRACDPRGGRMYGGALAAQMVAAARAATVGPPQTSSVELRFLRPADGGLRADYRVEPVQDGRSSAVRQVTVMQQGRTVAIGTVGFHTPHDGWVHGGRPAGVRPDSLPMTGTPHRSRAVTADAFDIRYHDETRDGGIVRHLWFRTLEPLPANVSVHECVVMYLSDIYFYEPICLEHGVLGNDRSIRYATTQHVVWFHRAPRADEWLLLESQSPVFAGGRGLVYGEVRTVDGAPVATVMQEVAIRVLDAAGEPLAGR
jgi:acyl-CoA thioesterase II